MRPAPLLFAHDDSPLDSANGHQSWSVIHHRATDTVVPQDSPQVLL